MALPFPMNSTQHAHELTQLTHTNTLTLPCLSYSDSYLCIERSLESQDCRYSKSPSSQHKPLITLANQSHRHSDHHNDAIPYAVSPEFEIPSHQPSPTKQTSSSYATPFETVDIDFCEMRGNMNKYSEYWKDRPSNST